MKLIMIENLYMVIGEKEILRNINLDRGEIFSLICPSGAGKTTLLRILNLLDRNQQQRRDFFKTQR